MRGLYVSERIDRFENPPDDGNPFIDADSRGDVPPSVRDAYSRRLQQNLDSDVSTEDESEVQAPRKVQWSEHEGDASTEPNTKGSRNPPSRPSKRQKTAVGIQKRRKERVYKVKSDEKDEDDSWEPDIPAYIKRRRDDFERKREELELAGLMIPPSYDDVDFSDDERMEELAEKPVFKTESNAPYKDILLSYSLGVIPAPLAQWLRPYQVEGAAFLHEAFVFQKGAILGDDMGLGKTIQVIAFLTAAFGKTSDERDAKRMRKIRRAGTKWYPRVLVVCPGGLMDNWQSELRRWGWWHVDVYHGGGLQKQSILDSFQTGRCEVMITTYTTYRLNKNAINLVEWDAVVADECHLIKSPQAEVTKAMNEVNALCRIGLTGTAIQNNYEELWTLLNWTSPGCLGPMSSWKKTISRPLQLGQSHDATVPQLAQARSIADKLTTNLLPKFFLRRMKSLIKHQLPRKSDRVVFCPLTASQADAYETFCGGDIAEAIRQSSELCDCGSRKKRGWCCHTHVRHKKWQELVFPAIITLQKLANHLAMLIPSSRDPTDKQEKDLDNLALAVPDRYKELYRQRDNILHYANPEFCGKWRILKKLLTLWHATGDKVLVFSHSVRLLRMLETLFNTTTSFNVSLLSGAQSYEERAQVVDEYNANPQQFVFLISTRAGGVGLNITAANKVVIFDPNWNPAHDLQAQDRAYRIGQTRDVEVFRLVSAGTIEEIVYARQIYKQQQANIGYNASLERRYFKGVQDSKDQKGEIFGLANVFAFHGENVVLQEIVNKTNIAESRAGVNVVGIDMDNQEEDSLPFLGHEDAQEKLISQLSDLIKDGDDPAKFDRSDSERRKPKTDAVQAILASAGVAYSHENSQVIGTSAMETKLSRHAQEAALGDDSTRMMERVFASSQPSPHDPRRRAAAPVYDDDRNSSDSESPLARTLHTRYQPPEHVRRRHFCELARFFGFAETLDGVTEFALVVESWTQQQRRVALERFYKGRRKVRARDLRDVEEEDEL